MGKRLGVNSLRDMAMKESSLTATVEDEINWTVSTVNKSWHD